MHSITEDEKDIIKRLTARLPPTPPAEPDWSDTSSISNEEAELDGFTQKPPAFPLPPPTNPPQEILDIDSKTPDAHVPRDARLIRLTGVHPFNVEAPLTDLFNEGFLTSPELFYVRNHGAVPQVEEASLFDWEFTVEGLVDRPFKISLRSLMEDYADQIITVPVTLVCAGNRRKEQNMVRKSKGFSWGPGGVSTALFTGVPMSAIIAAAKPTRRARYVCMEGADKLPNGYYGTSVKRNWVQDPNRGIMLAWKMNGELLRPDHGRPLRAVIPGQIGGRSVKWLTKLILTESPSDNWYHINDNRVLPTMVSPEESAADPSWWTDDRYAIYDLNSNSAIAYPAHDEVLPLSTRAVETYDVRGYAYGGGGRRITRVEITLDKGKTWRLAKIDYPEDRYREALENTNLYGGRLDMFWRETSFCWCFWSLAISTDDLAASADIMVRCMDEGLALQPREMYWSALGMMNNPWFRIVIHRENDTMRFEHPTQPALMPGGWMERVKKEGGNLVNGFWGERMGSVVDEEQVMPEIKEDIKMTKDGIDRIIEIDELRKHDTEEEPWFVVDGEVYNGTAFLKDHPGGAQSIISAAGLDSTDEFVAIHSETAKAMMSSYHIGSLSEVSQSILAEGSSDSSGSNTSRPLFLDARGWNSAALHSKKIVSWDTRIFTFQLEHEEQLLGLPVGRHLMMRLKDPDDQQTVVRAYTPISEQTTPGFVDVLVKVYFDTTEQKGGKMTKALDQLPVGGRVYFKGPIGKFEYLGKGLCSINGDRRTVREFRMICGGSGITPIYQVLRAIMQDPNDGTHCTVLDGNRLEEDILCKDELDAFAAGNPDRCRILHTLTKAGDGWQGLTGRIGENLLAETCPSPYDDNHEGQSDTLVLICGPGALEKTAHKVLTGLGWKDDDLLFF
ncbi:nitrate reductase-like protein [Eremomyces bilateralis CBS 781.70]|uniref:Nitrate reductase n=1 Tax=Eremomyces bilateralis CBS 781.70 TaxID=1392243 RepID=A0A6G1G0D8_9PEZI|nr:nitrate reductase-like protein [Eremomyces bilateralis CBS 781.70]KAF1811577.1 nitrate reductase-like protein [Eremomyces bilateralis CBS 781.70]